MIKEAIVLAGGLGTRLKGVISDIPKPMAPIGNVPFLEYLFNWLYNSGVNRIILAVGYKYEVIEQYFGNAHKGMELIYAVENEPLGTGGAIANAIPFCKNDDFLLVNGDTFFDVSLCELSDFHTKFNSQLTLSLKSMTEFDRYGTVELNGDRITAFKEKAFIDKGFINGGVYCANKSIFNNSELGNKYSFEKDIMESGVGKVKMLGRPFDSYFIDIGIPEDYSKASIELPFLLDN